PPLTHAILPPRLPPTSTLFPYTTLLRSDRDHRLAEVPHLADRERVVLDVTAGRRRDLEERIRQDRHLVACERAEDPRDLERRGEIGRASCRERVRGTVGAG